MANKEDLAAKLAREMASVFNKEIYGDEGPHLDTDIDQIEDVAVNTPALDRYSKCREPAYAALGFSIKY